MHVCLLSATNSGKDNQMGRAELYVGDAIRGEILARSAVGSKRRLRLLQLYSRSSRSACRSAGLRVSTRSRYHRCARNPRTGSRIPILLHSYEEPAAGVGPSLSRTALTG